MDCHKGLFHVDQLDGTKSNKNPCCRSWNIIWRTSCGLPDCIPSTAAIPLACHDVSFTRSWQSLNKEKSWTFRRFGTWRIVNLLFKAIAGSPSLSFFSVVFFLHTLPKTSSPTLKIGHLKKKFHLPTIDFRCYDVCLREGIIKYDWILGEIPKARGISVQVHRKSVVPLPLGLNKDFRKTFFLAIFVQIPKSKIKAGYSPRAGYFSLSWDVHIISSTGLTFHDSKCKQWDLQLKTALKR